MVTGHPGGVQAGEVDDHVMRPGRAGEVEPEAVILGGAAHPGGGGQFTAQAVGEHRGDVVQQVDYVASMLPYGLRSELSAATWVSSTAKNHRFRLYFSSAPRPHDMVIDLASLDATRVAGHHAAARYLTWLLDGDIEQHWLDLRSAEPGPLKFGDQTAAWLLDWTGRKRRRHPPGTARQEAYQVRQSIAQPAIQASGPRSELPARLSPEQVIRDYADRLLRGDARRDIGPLYQATQGLTADDRANCRDAI